ncbi:serine/threonine protein kinase AGC family [Phycomyces blakesleeanus]|uniref:non-specific serine/threonine protein kinase n=2 Tax=Phycomyces blakesleeanus TaxID=4837 RepID=A0A163AW84_PHYB8|nr:serine/threonine protein kinase AGC family [Phycomyces blakesleeanus NRRL 1555(-)]OAD76211.1 serine/threonine protein kinase AGC family [Phycomyces blakesleeanus NRRL 1555(-)]|eukprot:XP_018294251.1 serine/threonine protein kinase AGC family [Phycomyces blakesleeanus NRRL 1555(-)]
MNSWKLPGVKKNKESATPQPPVRPPPSHAPAASSVSSQPAEPKSGVLLIRVCEAQGISLPSGVQLPPIPHQPQTSRNRDSLSRRQNWWLPYVVLEFDKNEVLIDALGGDTAHPVYQYRAHFDVSRSSEVSISIYLRHPPTAQGVSTHPTNDYFLGAVKMTPNFNSTKFDDQVLTIVGGTGAMHVQLCYTPQQQNQPIAFDAFDLLRVIGRGSFGKVYVVRKKDTNRIYAMKVLRKSRIISRSEVTHTMAEKTVLAKIRNPFIVPLKFAFQSPDKLYLVLAFINGGELFHHLQVEGKFDEERSRFYTAELLCALECLHDYNVIYRDLKPENILIDYNGHIALCDFGLCKLNMKENDRTNTFCGTPEYLAPELLLGQGYTKTVDWWTLGVLLYEMMTGLPPFYDENTNEMYRKILQDELRFPDEMSEDSKGLLRGLLTRDPNERLGNNGPEDIKNHPFFARIDWQKLMQKKVQPPFKPSVDGSNDTSNFDEEFTSEAPQESVVDESQISKTMQEQFAGFTYNPANDGVMSESYTQAAGSHHHASGPRW